MTQLSVAYPSGQSPSDLSSREKQAFSEAVNKKIAYHRLGTFADVPKSSSYKNKSVNLFTSGYYYSLENNMLVCSHCEYSFNANDHHNTEQHRRKNLRCPGLGNTGFLNFRNRPQIQDIALNELLQNEQDLFNFGRGIDATDSYVANVEEVERVGFDTLASGRNSDDDCSERSNEQQIKKFNEVYHFNETQIQVLLILGMFYADESIQCSLCSYKVNWNLPFFNLIKSHYSMFSACPSRKNLTKTENEKPLILLARTLSICLPTFAKSTKKVSQSKAIILAGSGLAFQWRNNMFYCYWCHYVAPGNVKTMPHEALFRQHFEAISCPFVKMFSLKIGPTIESSVIHTEFLKIYLDCLLAVAVIEECNLDISKNKSGNGEVVKLLDPPMAYHSFDLLQNPDPSLSLEVSLLDVPHETSLPEDDSYQTRSGPRRELYQAFRYLSERNRIHPNLRSVPTLNRQEGSLSSGPAFIGTCVICLASPGDQVFVGCGHVATCKGCSIQGWFSKYLSQIFPYRRL